MAVKIEAIAPLDATLTYQRDGQDVACTLKFYTLYKVRCYGSGNMKERAKLTRHEDDCTYHFTLKPSEMFTLCVDATPRLVVMSGSPVLHGGTIYFTNGNVTMLSTHRLNVDIQERIVKKEG